MCANVLYNQYSPCIAALMATTITTAMVTASRPLLTPTMTMNAQSKILFLLRFVINLWIFMVKYVKVLL